MTQGNQPGPGGAPHDDGTGPAGSVRRGLLRGRVGAAAGAVVSLGVVVVALTVWPFHLPHTPAPPDDPAPSSSTDPAGATGSPDSPGDRFFAADDPFNQRRPPAREAAQSKAMVLDLLSGGKPKLYALHAGIPLYHATSHTPTYSMKAREHVGKWGPDPLAGNRMPWDSKWSERLNYHKWSLVTTPDGKAIECYRVRVSDGRPSCEWGAVTDTTKSSVPRTGAPTGSGLSRLAGVITSKEWRSGHIEHALAFGRPDNSPRHVYPARHSDGHEKESRWQLGQYIWLDEAYDIEHDPTLTPYERIVAHALQDYGAYDVKSTKEFEFTSENGAVPPGAGGVSYLSLADIKWARYLHVGTVDAGGRGTG